jgi:hypothetical protein
MVLQAEVKIQSLIVLLDFQEEGIHMTDRCVAHKPNFVGQIFMS